MAAKTKVEPRLASVKDPQLVLAPVTAEAAR